MTGAHRALPAPQEIFMKILAYTFFAAALLATSSPLYANNKSGTTASVDPKNTGTSVYTNFDKSWAAQNNYWRNAYPSTPYYNTSIHYSSYEPAYRYGVSLYKKNRNLPYDQLEPSQLDSGWNSARGKSNLHWSEAQQATRDAYMRMYDNRNSNIKIKR